MTDDSPKTGFDVTLKVTPADSALNEIVNDVIGNKNDTVAGNSLMALSKQIIVAVGGAAIQLRVEQSETGSVEEDGIISFGISIFDIDAGAIVSGDIDITGISAVLEKSTGGGAFSSAGITQPTFAKTNGLVSVDYRFLLAEWEIGDIYKLVVSGITATIDGDTAHVKTLLWSNVITELVNVEDKIDAIQADLGDVADAATNDNMSDITTTTALAKLRLVLNRLSTDAFTADIQGSARTALDTMMAHLATYFSASGAAMSIQVNNQTARTNLEQALEDFFKVMGIDGTNVFDPALIGGSQTTLEAAFAALGTALGAEFDGSPDLYDALYTGINSSTLTNNFDGSIHETLKAGLEKDTAGAFDADTDSNEAIRGQLDETPAANNSKTFNATALQSIQDEAEDALEGEDLDHFLKLDGATHKYPENCATDSILAKMLVKADPAVPDQFDNSTDSLEAIRDRIDTLVNPVLKQQPDVAVNVAANIAAVNIFDLNTAGITYMVNSLRLKAVDPGAETITVTLYELINDVSVAVDTFTITTANFGNYFSLYDMFSVQQLAGDDIQITIHASADGAYAVTGQYQYSQAQTV